MSRIQKLEKVADLISRIFHYGNFKAETSSEKELENLLTDLGYWPSDEDDILNRDKINLSFLAENNMIYPNAANELKCTPKLCIKRTSGFCDMGRCILEKY